jgi:hypothetical protein
LPRSPTTRDFVHKSLEIPAFAGMTKLQIERVEIPPGWTLSVRLRDPGVRRDDEPNPTHDDESGP